MRRSLADSGYSGSTRWITYSSATFEATITGWPFLSLSLSLADVRKRCGGVWKMTFPFSKTTRPPADTTPLFCEETGAVVGTMGAGGTAAGTAAALGLAAGPSGGLLSAGGAGTATSALLLVLTGAFCLPRYPTIQPKNTATAITVSVKTVIQWSRGRIRGVSVLIGKTSTAAGTVSCCT